MADDGQTIERSSSARALDAETARELVAAVNSAKSRGWLQPDLRRFFQAHGVDLSTYKAAGRCETVSGDAAALFAQISITGLPDAPHAPNPDDMRRHLEWLTEPARGSFDDALIEIAYDGDGRGPSHARLFSLDELEDAVAFACARNREWRNVYVGAALRLPDTPRSGRASAQHFYVATAVPIDIDQDYDATRARMTEVCDDGLVVVTGLTPQRRSQHWTRLAEPCDDEADFGHAFGALVLSSGADMKVKDAARIMRLGGSVSYPRDERKRLAGYCTELTATHINPQAHPSDIERLKALEPAAATAERFDTSKRQASTGEVERTWTGKVIDGREAHFRDLLLRHLRAYQDENGADPSVNELLQLALVDFEDPAKVDNSDGRWTGPSGILQLTARAANTMRRLRAGRLARVGLASIDTGIGAEEAAEVRRNREAVRNAPAPFVEAVVTQEAQAPQTPHTAGGQPAFDPWERYLTPAFPLELLPARLQRFVRYQAASTGADISSVAMATLAACSGAVDQQFELKMKRTGEWHVRPRLWVVLVGDPSQKKTPVISACVKPLRAWERVKVETYQREFARWKEDKDNGAKEPEPTKPTRYILNDVTTEKVGDLLSRQDRGALVEHDELSGWIGSMDKYSGGKGSSADRSFWAQAFNGGPKTIDRLARGEIYVRNLAVAFLGGIQPERLSQLSDLTSDGLLQRFLPVMMRRAVFPGEVEDDGAAVDYDGLVRMLISLSPHILRMDEGGLAAAEEFQRFIFELEGAEGLGRGFCSFAGKLSGLHGSLALLLHLIEHTKDAAYEAVSERTVRNAAAILRDFCIPHALEFYRTTADGSGGEELRTIASFVLTSPKDRFVASDFMASVRSLRNQGTWEIGKKVSPLVAGGWLTEETVGAVVKAWNVVPGLREAMTKRRETELERKAELQRTLKKMKPGADS